MANRRVPLALRPRLKTELDKQQQEASVITGIPDRPWKKVTTDMLNWAGDEYLVTVDYHSGFFELDKLNDINAAAIIEKLEAHSAVRLSPILDIHSELGVHT